MFGKLANETQIATLQLLGKERAWESSPRETQRYIVVMEAIRTKKLDFRAAHAAMLAWSRLPFSSQAQREAAKAEKFSAVRVSAAPAPRELPQHPATPLVRDPFSTPAAIEAPAPVRIIQGIEVPPSNAKDKAPQVPAGCYVLNGTIYKIDRPERGRWAGYTFVESLDAQGRVTEKVRNALVRDVILAKILDAGPKECARSYGRQTGTCGMCGRELTNPESIARGTGPICDGRL